MIPTSERIRLVTAIAADRRCGRVHLAVAHLLFCHFYGAETGRCDPSVGTLARAAATDQRYARQALHDLAEWGYVTIEIGAGTPGKFGATNAYTPGVPAQGGRPSAPRRPSAGEAPQRRDPRRPSASKPIIQPIRYAHAAQPPITDHSPEHHGGQTDKTAKSPRPRDPRRPSAGGAAPCDPQFDAFRDAYPKGGRIDGPACRTKYRKLIDSGEITHERLMAAVRRYAVSSKVRDGFVCNLTTWLNQQRWMREEVSAFDATDEAAAAPRSRAAI